MCSIDCTYSFKAREWRHLKEGVVSLCDAHILDVIGAYALLGASGSRILPRSLPAHPKALVYQRMIFPVEAACITLCRRQGEGERSGFNPRL